jgi:hypothetical protein
MTYIPEAAHGTAAGYLLGCDCQCCTAAGEEQKLRRKPSRFQEGDRKTQIEDPGTPRPD